MPPLRLIPLGLLALLVVTPAPAQAPQPADPATKSIDKGVRFLRDLENNRGDFEHTSLLVGRARPGGLTALATVALLRSKVPANDPLIQRCLHYLRTVHPSQSYTVGLQTMAFCLAGEPQDRPRIQRNLDWIADNYVKWDRGKSQGGWGYETGSKSPDHSINFYVLLGLREAHKAGFKMNRAMLSDLRDNYRQSEHGVWNYRSDRGGTLTMTSAGLHNLVVLNELLGDRPTDDDNRVTARSLRWLGNEFPRDVAKATPSHPFYCLHAVREAAEVTKSPRLGQRDWRAVGRKFLLDIQQQDGSWKGNGGFDPWPPVATSLALLFLAEGR